MEKEKNNMEDSKEQVQNNIVLMLAEKFHRYYEELAPKYGYETKQETKKFDRHSPNGKLMYAVCEKIIQDLVI